ncbi:hypothetical protein F5H01DRAFT_377967 [Linnemannia elongata]|nr:hypothetical protein F5H01DRAFT_377967 [Linnemannia elongata]
MLDEFLIDKDEGFPDHPHYGFESVTYMLEYQKQHNGAYNNQTAEFDWRKNRAKLFWLAINVSVSKVAMEKAPEWTNLVMDQALRRPAKLTLAAKTSYPTAKRARSMSLNTHLTFLPVLNQRTLEQQSLSTGASPRTKDIVTEQL